MNAAFPAAVMAVLVGLPAAIRTVRRLRRARTHRRPMRVVIDGAAVTRERADGVTERVAWDELTGVDVYTTADGPFADDFFWVLYGARGSGCVVPGPHAAGLLERLQKLPGFDNRAVVLACGSVEEAWFRCWRSAGGSVPR